jgi:putative transposase
VLTPEGIIVAECWEEIRRHFPSVRLDRMVVMPDHLHGIIILKSGCPPLFHIIGLFKAACSRRINRLHVTGAGSLWQRGFHDRIVRDATALRTIRRYIDANPSRWRD